MFRELYNRDGLEILINHEGTTIRVNGMRYSTCVFKMFSDLAEAGDILKFEKRKNETVFLSKVDLPGGDNE